MSSSLRVSVVVCTHNGAATLPAALAALREQDLDPREYEVIVVDDGSGDGSADLAEAAGARVVRLEDNRGVAVARNAGARAARGPVVAFTDDDCEASRSWLRELIAAFDDESVDGAAGAVVPAGDSSVVLRYLADRDPLAPLPSALLRSTNPFYRLGLYLRSAIAGRPRPGDGDEVYSVVTANGAFRREFLLALGGFDPSFRLGEDGDLCRRAHDSDGGARFVYRPRALVRHHFRPELSDTLRRARGYGCSNAHMAAKHGDVNPVLYPFPFLIAGAALAAVVARPRLLPLAALLPLVTYPAWPALAARRRRVEPLTYSYLQLAEEVATMHGEVLEWSR
jgi:glycosyltransferase involved in cell wall biosynthesis